MIGEVMGPKDVMTNSARLKHDPIIHERNSLSVQASGRSARPTSVGIHSFAFAVEHLAAQVPGNLDSYTFICTHLNRVELIYMISNAQYE